MNTQSIQPIGDRLLLRITTRQLGMIGGIHIPDTGMMSSKTSCECEVIAVGKDVEEVKKGDRVNLSVYDKKAAGTEIEHGGEKLILIKERDINGILKD